MSPAFSIEGAPNPTAAGDAAKRYFEGTHRVVPPAETIARVRPHFAAIGITRVANVTGLDRLGVPVVTVCRPNSRSLAVFQGKGVTLDAAKASGIMEAVEVWHAERIVKPLKLASFDEMRSEHRMADVDGLPRGRPAALDSAVPMLWIEANDVMGAGSTWVPHELVSMNYTLPLPPGCGWFQANSNGLASGNHMAEAVLHGLCEVIERDARSLWELSSPDEKAARMLDLARVNGGPCRQLLDRFTECGLSVHAWDVTSDIGVAAFVCQLVDPNDQTADPEVGSGCHPAREIALLRALTEAAQARTTYIAGSRDDYLADWYELEARRQRRAIMLQRTAGVEAQRDFSLVPTFESPSLDADVRWLLARLRSAGISQVLVVDLTRDALGIPVAKVIVPGLEGARSYGEGEYVMGKRARRVTGMPL